VTLGTTFTPLLTRVIGGYYGSRGAFDASIRR